MGRISRLSVISDSSRERRHLAGIPGGIGFQRSIGGGKTLHDASDDDALPRPKSKNLGRW